MAMAMAIAGTVMAVMGALQQGKAASNAAKHNAAVNDRNALIARQQAEEDVNRQRRDTRRRMGSIRARYGASGVTLEGSPLDVIEDSAAEAELDALTIQHQGELKAQGFDINASMDRTRAKVERQAGFMKAGTALLSGASKAYGASQ